MSARLDALLGRIFAHHYPSGADPVDWREARALWRAQQAAEAAPAVYATATGAAWPVDNIPPFYGIAREEWPVHPAPVDHSDL